MYNRNQIIQTMQEIYDESKSICPYVVIAQPRRDKKETAAQNFNGYEGLHIDLLGTSHGFIDIDGEKVDVARNYLMEQALESGAKYMFFVGEDTVIPYDGFKKLHKTAEENPGTVVVGVYYMKCSEAMIMVKNDNWIQIPNVDPGQVIEAWQTGMDAMLIPISILKEMKEENPELPFCCIGNNIDGSNGVIPFVGEDNFFVHRLHKRGTKLLVDTDVQCLHMDLATGMYTAHPSVNLAHYYTNIKPTRPLTLDDKDFIDRRWIDRLPEGTGSNTLISTLNILAQDNAPVKFNMGCGNDRLPGYIGIDKYSSNADYKLDITEVELPDGCADEILASHVIEHIPQHRIIEVIKRWNNALKSGGKLILETPDLHELCKMFVSQSEEDRWLTTMCMYGAFVDHVTPDVEKTGNPSPHLWGFSKEGLSLVCKKAGFNDISIEEAVGKHPGSNFRLIATKE